VARTEWSERQSCGALGDALLDELADHADETGMRADGGGADEIEAEMGGLLSCFVVEVVENLHMVGDEADRDGDHVGGSAGASSSRRRRDFHQRIANIGAEPRLMGRAAAALINEPPVVMA